MLVTYFIIALLGFIICMVTTAIQDKKNFVADWKMISLISVSGGVVISFIVMLIVHAIFPFVIPYDSRTETIPLYSLSDNYYVDSGHSEYGSTVYRYLAEADNGLQITAKELKDCCVYFKYTDDTPYLEITSDYYRNGWWNIFFMPAENRKRRSFFSDVIYVFHIPQNSITTKLTIDLE